MPKVFRGCSMNYSKHVVTFIMFNTFQNRYPTENFEFVETNLRPWGAVQDKSDRSILNNLKFLLVCRLDKLLSWFSTQTFVVNFRYYLFCLCNVRRQYLLPGILGIHCYLTGVSSLPAIALPKGRICSLVNQVYTFFPLMSLPPFGLH